MIVPLRIKGRPLRPPKASISPSLDTKTVLTRSPWEFVSLWLAREGKREASFYWDQARRFAEAASKLPLESAPLLHYYSFMNAAKALLVARGIAFKQHHGVRAHNMRTTSNHIDLSNEGVSIQPHGVLPSLASYLGDSEVRSIHSLKDILYNLPFVHRTYCLTYRSQTELFYPLAKCEYSYDSANHHAFLTAVLTDEFADGRHLRRLPPTFVANPASTTPGAIRSSAAATVARARVTSQADIAAIRVLHRVLRKDFVYINGAQPLWYIKAQAGGATRLQRSLVTLTLAAMHRLSELCRYRPIEFASFLRGQRNWLISEFVRMAPEQFLDEIASELTGYQFLAPNIRPPS